MISRPTPLHPSARPFYNHPDPSPLNLHFISCATSFSRVLAWVPESVCRQPCTLPETSADSLLLYRHFAYSPIFSGPLHSSLESSTGSRPFCRITERRQRAWYQLFVLFHGTSTSLFYSRFILSSRRISTSEPGVNSSDVE